MKVKAKYSFTIKNLELFDMTILLIYRGYNLWQFRQVKMRRADVIRSTVYANGIVANYLRRV